MWDILLATKGEAKKQAGSILTTKAAQFQMEYTGTCRTKMTIDGVPMDISEDRVESFLSHYGRVQEVSAVVSKSGIASGDFVFQVTLTHQSFGKTPNILLCKGRRMLVVAEVRKPYFWHGGGPRDTWQKHDLGRVQCSRQQKQQNQRTGASATTVPRGRKTASSSSPRQHEAPEAERKTTKKLHQQRNTPVTVGLKGTCTKPGSYMSHLHPRNQLVSNRELAASHIHLHRLCPQPPPVLLPSVQHILPATHPLFLAPSGQGQKGKEVIFPWSGPDLQDGQKGM